MLPKEFPPRSTIQRYFHARRSDGTLRALNHHLLMAAVAFRVRSGHVHVMSTHIGETNPFVVLMRDVREGLQPGSVHRCTVRDAISDGLYRCICAVTGETWSAEGVAA